MVTRQRLRGGAAYAGKMVTIHVGDTHFRVTCDGTELSMPPAPNNARHRWKPRSTPRNRSPVQHLLSLLTMS